MRDIYQFLNDNHIEFERFDHQPVYTVDDVKRLASDLPGVKTKNLFLRDKKGQRHFLVSVPAEKRVDLKRLAEVLESTKLSFASPNRLKKHLGIDPGAVSLLAIINDHESAVEVFVDKEIWRADAFQYHPLVNTSTLTLKKDALKRFLEKEGHTCRVINVPSLN